MITPPKLSGRLEGLALVRVQEAWKYKPVRWLADLHSQVSHETGERAETLLCLLTGSGPGPHHQGLTWEST